MTYEQLMDKRSLIELAAEGKLSELLSVDAAKKLASELDVMVLTNKGWETEKTGKEPAFIITEATIDKVVSVSVCRKKGFPVRVPTTYKATWR